MRFTAAIGKQASAAPQSRAAGSAWAAGDAIGIFMVANRTDRAAEADNKGAGYRKSTAGKVNLQFTHRLTKITFRCQLDASVGSVNPDAGRIGIVLMFAYTASGQHASSSRRYGAFL